MSLTHFLRAAPAQAGTRSQAFGEALGFLLGSR
jgi:hypothetical protein